MCDLWITDLVLDVGVCDGDVLDLALHALEQRLRVRGRAVDVRVADHAHQTLRGEDRVGQVLA